MEDIGSERPGSFQLLQANEPLYEKQKANRMILGYDFNSGFIECRVSTCIHILHTYVILHILT